MFAAAHGRADLQQLAPGDRVIEKLCMRETREQYDNEGKYIVRTWKSTSQQELTLDFFTRDGLLNLWRPGVDVMMDFETAHKLLYPTPPVPISSSLLTASPMPVTTSPPTPSIQDDDEHEQLSQG